VAHAVVVSADRSPWRSARDFLRSGPISNGVSLAVLASSACDLGLVAYEMTLLVEHAGRVLAPAARTVNHVAVGRNGHG
jgi:hypothetical protein